MTFSISIFYLYYNFLFFSKFSFPLFIIFLFYDDTIAINTKTNFTFYTKKRPFFEPTPKS